MIVTLTGENGFTLRQELRKLTDAYIKEHGELELERLDGESSDLDRISAALTSLPMLAGRKMVVLRTPGALKQVQEHAEQLLGGVPETTDVIIVEPKLDKRLSYYKFLKKSTDFREFPELDQQGLAGWLSAEAKKHGGSLSISDARYLVERVGVRQQLLEGELEKLLLYKPEISRQTIELLTDASPQSTIFQMIEAAFNGDSRRALKLYTEQRAMNVDTKQIIALLTWQLHVLAVIKTAGDRNPSTIASEARINPYVVQKSQAIARRLRLDELKKLISDLLKIDIQTKRTALDPDEALQHYILSLAGNK